MLIELIGLLKSPVMRLAMHVNRGTDICCLLISETLQRTVPSESNNIAQLDFKATRAKFSMDRQYGSIVRYGVRKSPSQFALCFVFTEDQCVRAIIMVPHFAR